MKKRYSLRLLFAAAACAIAAGACLLTACGTTPDAASGPPAKRPSWTSTGFTFSVGFQGITAGITIPARASAPDPEPPLPQETTGKASIPF